MILISTYNYKVKSKLIKTKPPSYETLSPLIVPIHPYCHTNSPSFANNPEALL